MKLILTIILALLLFIVFAAAGPFRVDENMELGLNDIYNATNINATYFWQNGLAVLDTGSTINISGINQSLLNVNSSSYWDSLDDPTDITVLGSIGSATTITSTVFIGPLTGNADSATTWDGETSQADLNVNSSNSTDYWDALNTPADFTWSGDLSGSGLSPSVIDDSHFHGSTTVTSVNASKIRNMDLICGADTFFTGINHTDESGTCTGISDVYLLNSGDEGIGSYDFTGTYVNVTGDFHAAQYVSDNGNFKFNFYDDGSELVMNVSSITDAFVIETDNTKLVLYNSPSAGNDWKVFQIYSKEASDETEFVITKAKDEFTSYFIRSLALVGNGTLIPTPWNCTTFADHIDCKTDVTGPDLFVLDDVEIDGQLFVDGTGVNYFAGSIETTELNITSLTNCDTIDTDSNGFLSCGTDAGVEYTADETNITLDGTVFRLLPLDLVEHINSLNWITAGVAALDNFFTKTETDTHYWNETTDIDDDEITEAKIAFSTACSGGEYYRKDGGNDLECTTPTDTTYTNGSGLTLVGTEFNHSDTSSQSDSDNSGNTFVQDIILDTFGHITSIVTAAVDFSSYWDTANDLDTVISADEISESKIEFTTACAAGNHYYKSGNDLACEADDYNAAFDTEDEIEAAIFDTDNTANLGLTGYNISAINCIIFDSGGKVCSGS